MDMAELFCPRCRRDRAARSGSLFRHALLMGPAARDRSELVYCGCCGWSALMSGLFGRMGMAGVEQARDRLTASTRSRWGSVGGGAWPGWGSRWVATIGLSAWVRWVVAAGRDRSRLVLLRCRCCGLSGRSRWRGWTWGGREGWRRRAVGGGPVVLCWNAPLGRTWWARALAGR